MTEDSSEYKILHFLNDRFECFEITLQALRVGIFEIPDVELMDKLTVLINVDKTVANKDRQPFGFTITPSGKKRLNQMQGVIDSEKKIKKPFREKYFWAILIVGWLITYVGGVFSPVFSDMVKNKFQVDSTKQAKAKIDTVYVDKHDTVLRLIHDTILFPDKK